MSSEDHKSNSVTKLTSSNYPTWKGEMKAYLRVKGLWLLVNGSETRPKSDTDAQAKWDVKADKAAGELYLACSVEQRMHIDAVQDDPVKIWTTLASIHLQQRPGARFNAWDDFFSIRKLRDESLSTLTYAPDPSSSELFSTFSDADHGGCKDTGPSTGGYLVKIGQNGVAERANRVLSERLTTMLDESGLPKAFWGECLAALVHVWNRCPTEAVRSTTPYELWHGRKPDISHLRVWGCTAYVHIQKDNRAGLGSHMEKCVFIGYPQGYKGWKFYNPTTKKTVIAERADYDERYFPLSKRLSSPSIAPPSPAVENTPAVHKE
jgi:hypothetical protein